MLPVHNSATRPAVHGSLVSPCTTPAPVSASSTTSERQLGDIKAALKQNLTAAAKNGRLESACDEVGRAQEQRATPPTAPSAMQGNVDRAKEEVQQMTDLEKEEG